MIARLARSRLLRLLVVVLALVGVAAALWWRGPDWGTVGSAFEAVRWEWVVAAVGLNLLSIVARSNAWKIVIDQAIDPPTPGYPLVFSAFCVGLLANAVLPGRIGELARVAVLTRRLPGRKGVWATLVGTVFAHRVFDLVPVMGLILFVLATAKIPAWAVSSLIAIVAVGIGLFVFAFLSARYHRGSRLDGFGTVRRLVELARYGLGVMHRPASAALAIGFQSLGWVLQLFAVYTTMRAFDIHASLPAAGLVLLVMNVVTIIPLWPGNVGAVQAAIALPLRSYGVAYGTGIAFGFGLQAIEASVGIGIGLLFLAHEGLSFAALRRMPAAAEAEIPSESPASVGGEVEREGARVPG